MPHFHSYALRLGPLGPAEMHVESFVGHEEISGLYAFNVTLVTSLPRQIFEALVLGQRAVFAMRVNGRSRSVRGICSSLRWEGIRQIAGSDWVQVTARVVPRMHLLGLRKNYKIFRRTRVADVIRDVLRAWHIPAVFELEGEYAEIDYLTQYDETDYAFVTRIAAEAGMLFYFQQPPAILDEAIFQAMEAAGAPGTGVLPVLAELASVAAGFAESALGPPERVVFTNHDAYLPLAGATPDDLLETALDEAAQHIPDVASSFGEHGPPLRIGVKSPSLRFSRGGIGRRAGEEEVGAFSLTRSIRSVRTVFRDYDPERPLSSPHASKSLGRGEDATPGLGVSIDPHTGLPSFDVSGLEDLLDARLEPSTTELYAHGGRTLFPAWRDVHAEPERMLQRARRDARHGRGTANACRIEPGHRFELEDHPDDLLNADYAVTRAEHRGTQVYDAGTNEDTLYQCTFECVPAGVPYLPRLPEPRVVQACHTATVAGPANEEIHVNERGEIKVQFHWDRHPAAGDSSVWIRSMQPWAGAGWGSQFIPRVGTEVVVVFEGGDPDKPLVLGSVYNAVHPMPFHLPGERSRSGIRTRSTPSSEGYNELSFEDAAAREQVLLRAQRDFDTVVLRNRTATVNQEDRTLVHGDRSAVVDGGDSTRVGGDRATHVVGGDTDQLEGSRHSTIQGDLRLRVGRDRHARVEGDDRREIIGDDRVVTHGSSFTEVRRGAAVIVGRHDEKGSANVLVEGPTTMTGTDVIDIHSEKQVVLRCGHSFIRICSGEIDISSSKVTVRGKDARLLLGDGAAKLKVKQTFQVVSEDQIALVSSGASLGLKSEAKLDGSQVLLNSPTAASDTIQASEPQKTKIELVDRDGAPIPYQRFVIELEGGGTYVGYLDEEGKAEVDVEGSGHVTFPDLTNAASA
ncbi:MAG: type VI secretion system tip protein TssI/VgrG [Polyangiaceae bacterium]